MKTVYQENYEENWISWSNRRAALRAAFHRVALILRRARQIILDVGVFVKKPKVPSPALNNESILVKILG